MYRILERCAFTIAAGTLCCALVAQSFTQTVGELSSQDGVGAMPSGQGFLISVRNHDPGTLQFSGQLRAVSSAGASQSTTEMGIPGSVFLQGSAMGTNGSGFFFGSVLPNDGHEHRGIVLKYGESGSVLWQALSNGSSSEQFLGATGMSDGGVVVCGVTTENEGHDVLLIRFGPDGDEIWRHVEVSPTDEEAHGVAEKNGTLMVTGRSVTFSGNSDMLFMRFDDSGVLDQRTTWGGVREDVARAIVPFGEQGFIAAGWTSSHGEVDVNTNTFRPRGYLLAINMEGDTLWSRVLGVPEETQRIFALAEAGNGDLFLGGESGTFATTDAVILRCDPTGGTIWERRLDTGKEERILHLLPLSDGVLGTGWSSGEFGRQILLIKRNAQGS